MAVAALPDLDQLDVEALKALLIAEREQRLQAHLELASRLELIEQLKLVIEKYRRMIFGRKSGKQPYWRSTLNRWHLQPAVKQAGIQGRIGWHTFRRTYATLPRRQCPFRRYAA